MRRWALFLILGVFLSQDSCVAPSLLPRETPSPEILLQECNWQMQAVRGLKGQAWVRVSSPQKNFNTQNVLFVRRPSFLRVETLGFLGTPQFYLVTNGQELSGYSPTENRYYQGPATVTNLSAFLPGDLTPGEIVALLLGGLATRDWDVASVRRDEGERLWVLELNDNPLKEKQILWVAPHPFRILRGEVHRRGFIWNIAFQEFRPLQGLSFANRISLASIQPPVQVTVDYEEITLNPSWETGDFLLPMPRGAVVSPWP